MYDNNVSVTLVLPSSQDILRRTEAFTRPERKRLRGNFDKYDRDRSEEISTDELGKVLRGLGHNVNVREQQELVAKVDADGSSTGGKGREEWEKAREEKDAPKLHRVYCWRLEQYFLRRAGLTFLPWQNGYTGWHRMWKPKRTRGAAKEESEGGATFAWERQLDLLKNKTQKLRKGGRRLELRKRLRAQLERRKRISENTQELDRQLEKKWGSQQWEPC